jgi:hypothetical protein
MDDRIELNRWKIDDCSDLSMALDEAFAMVEEEGEDANLSYVLWNDKQACANVGTAILFKVVMTDGSAAYEVELQS